MFTLSDTFRHTTLSRTPLDEWSGCLRDIYLVTNNNHKRATPKPTVGFEPKIPANERPQTHVLDRAPTGICCINIHQSNSLDPIKPCVRRADMSLCCVRHNQSSPCKLFTCHPSNIVQKYLDTCLTKHGAATKLAGKRMPLRKLGKKKGKQLKTTYQLVYIWVIASLFCFMGQRVNYLIFCTHQPIKLRYRISRPIRRTFFPKNVT
jgi:hypothetical protein